MAPIGDLLHNASSILATCTRHVARTARRLRRRHASASSPKIHRDPPARKKKKTSVIHLGGGPISCYIVLVRRSKKGAHKGEEEEDDDIYGVGADAGAGMEEEEEQQEEDAAVWRRTILMGEKCEPLNFPGVIYYDSAGRQLAEVPTPRMPQTPQRGESPPAPGFDRPDFESQEAIKY